MSTSNNILAETNPCNPTLASRADQRRERRHWEKAHGRPVVSEADAHDSAAELAQGRQMRRALEQQEREHAHLAFVLVSRTMRWACDELPANPDCIRKDCPNRRALVTA